MRGFEPVAGLGGVVLAGSLFAPWYRFVEPTGDAHTDSLLGVLNTYTGRLTDTAWQAFSVIDVVLALIAGLAIAVPAVSFLSSGPAKPIGIEVITSVTGLIGVLLVGFRLVDPSGADLHLRWGAWLALAGAVIAWIGSWMSMRDESTPGAKAPDVARRPAPPVAAA